ncbi:hypothetical protein EJ05DRAFT_307128 [Pseudovirgaria hyperparasitica]|uniref:Uncharacterized protein n=1 Tax=Pseudovirgaria hyperparasitica TaxID=470096 RepID=A0A6A6WDS1_9PEZI|nr:uncharacterized protein EJ05DRAFT_307128 [Pseudovirgaria hyperparasitica]KAF2759707.1 hypothetical protein EJ05DRAFT_307128 [Pseudovirgaria hyperparasitica]
MPFSDQQQRVGRTRKNSIFGWPSKGISSIINTSVSSTLSSIPSGTPEPPSTTDDSDSYTYPSPQPTIASSRHRRSISTSQGADSTLSRSTSLRSSSTVGSASFSSNNRAPSAAATLALSYSPEKGLPGSNVTRPALSITTFGRNRQKSTDNLRTLNSDSNGGPSSFSKSPLSAAEANSSVGMQPIPLRHNAPPPRPPGTSHSNYSQSNGVIGQATPLVPPSNGYNPSVVFQHIHDLATKRISTLDYLRKAHEGRVYWFNTLLFGKNDLARLQFFDPKKLGRRATNYLILGYSIPTILDLNSQSPTEYLRAWNTLLVEFETYQTNHPPDGSTPSSLTRARLPQMFKRANPLGGGKGRRSSSAADLMGLGNQDGTPSIDMSLSGESDLLPGEEYDLLLTPALPFDPDFFETFATLCDVLIDCYTKVMTMINSPEQCAPGVSDLFAKADARVRKVIVAGVVREFEEASRTGVKGEMAGVGKVVLGGLM